jgi:PAS domain S-box-containing protein
MNSPLRVLHLEDEARDTELVRATLEGEGIASELTRFDTEEDFIAALKHGSFNLILADYTLPSFDGLSALKIAQQHSPDVPFIFVSGTLGEDVAIEALKTGATDYVLKTRLNRLGPSVSRALREAQEKADLKRAEEALRKSEAYLAEAQTLSHTGSWAFRLIPMKMLYWSDELFRTWGFDPKEGLPDVEAILQRIHPEDREWLGERLQGGLEGKLTDDSVVDHRIVLPDGTVKYIHGVSHPIFDEAGQVVEYIGTAVDVTEQKRAEALFDGEKRLLEMIATGVALNEILSALCTIIEDYRGGALASVLLLRPDGLHLDSVAGPSLAKSWIEQMEKLPIGPCAGSCGTAAYRGSAVIVSDIATDPVWEVPEHRAAALQHGLRSSWSNPILSSDGKVLGTFCIYGRETQTPSQRDLELIEKATYIARVAIERDRTQLALQTSEEKYRDLINASPDAICVVDADGNCILINPAGVALVGRP